MAEIGDCEWAIADWNTLYIPGCTYVLTLCLALDLTPSRQRAKRKGLMRPEPASIHGCTGPEGVRILADDEAKHERNHRSPNTNIRTRGAVECGTPKPSVALAGAEILLNRLFRWLSHTD